MEIRAYINTAEKISVDKWDNMTPIGLYQGNLKTACDVVNPVITITDTDANILRVNYVNIREFNRFYFVTNIVSVRNGVWELSLHCDVLMSFSEHIINNTKGVIIRNEFDSNNLLPDNNIPFDNDIKYKKITYSIDTPSMAGLFAPEDSLDTSSLCFVLQVYDAV